MFLGSLGQRNFVGRHSHAKKGCGKRVKVIAQTRWRFHDERHQSRSVSTIEARGIYKTNPPVNEASTL